MSLDDWYRNENWNEEIEREFFRKLNRARSQRTQYLVIQAMILSENHPRITLRLVEEYFASQKSNSDDVRAIWARALAYLNLGDIENAMKSFRSVLDREDEFPNCLSSVYVDYPYIVATRKIEQEYDNAIKVLHDNGDRLTHPIEHFKWHAAFALIQDNRKQACKALEAAQIETSDFRYHPGFGLVGEAHEETIKQLCNISKAC
ncbi:MAG: hypothetical protein COA78_18465 [Blastopirellula sp.]|nr:MAG: hypothetical protein COA78_18465 [Blastopirellula sp.]